MNMPGFYAEASLDPTMGIYRGKASFGGSGMGEVAMQQLGTSSFLGRFGLTMRCCGYAFGFGFVCTTRIVSPLERCECKQNFFGYPVIICRPPVLSPN